MLTAMPPPDRAERDRLITGLNDVLQVRTDARHRSVELIGTWSPGERVTLRLRDAGNGGPHLWTDIVYRPSLDGVAFEAVNEANLLTAGRRLLQRSVAVVLLIVGVIPVLRPRSRLPTVRAASGDP